MADRQGAALIVGAGDATGGATARAFASGQTSLTTKIPIWVVNAGMFAAFALSILRTIQGFLRGAYRIDQPVVE